jgi:hypothetical protein
MAAWRYSPRSAAPRPDVRGRGFNLHQLSISLIKIKNGTNRRQFRQFGAIRTELGNLCTKNREISV